MQRLNPIDQPHAYEIEVRVIAALTHIGNPHDLKVQKAILLLDDQCFHNQDCRQMFKIVGELFSQQQRFTYVDFVTSIPRELIPTASLMVEDQYFSVIFLEEDVQKLLAFRAWRMQIRILIDAVNQSLDCHNPEDSLIAISDELQKISHSTQITSKPYKRSAEDILDEILTLGEVYGQDFKVDIPGLPPVPDESMITIAGRSGHGKTFFAMYLMDKIIDVKPDRQALYFNLEMRDAILLERLAILNGFRAENQLATLKKGAGKIISKNLTIFTKDATTIEEIETEARLSAMQCPLSVIVVDYMNLVRSNAKAERQDLQQSDIAKRLAGLATSLKCIVLCLIQVNRDIKNRSIGERCPIVTDSAESMGSVNSSSWWLGINQPQNDDTDAQWQHMFQVHCRKNRGDSGMFQLNLKFRNGMFSEYEKPFCNYSKPDMNAF